MSYQIDRTKFLLNDEFDALLKACSRTDHPVRNKAIILIGMHHGMRASELMHLDRSNVNLETGHLRFTRSKSLRACTHPLFPDDQRILKKALNLHNNHRLWLSEQKTPMAYTSLDYLMKRLGKLAGIDRPCHAHMLRHTCGYRMVNKGIDIRLIQDWLGHINIQNTVLYTALDEHKFDKITNF